MSSILKDQSVSGTLPRDQMSNASNRNSLHMDGVDGGSDVTRDRPMARLATFQAKPSPMQASSYATPEQKEKVWRATLQDKMADEILSSSSRETTGGDSGRGLSEDGSQDRASVTADDAGCLISPSHGGMRAHAPKFQANYSGSTSGSGYERPPLLMTFQSNSPDHANARNGSTGEGGNVGARKDFPYASPSSTSSIPRYFNGCFSNSNSTSSINKTNASNSMKTNGRHDHRLTGEKKVGKDEAEVTVHKIKCDGSPKDEQRSVHETSLKKRVNGDDGYGSNSSTASQTTNGNRLNQNTNREQSNSLSKTNSHSTDLIAGHDRYNHPSMRGRDTKMGSEPPPSTNGIVGVPSPYSIRGVQETGSNPFPSLPNQSAIHSSNKPFFVGGGADGNRLNKAKTPGPYSSPSSFHQPSKQNMSSCPQLYRGVAMSDPHSQSTLPSNNRWRSFNSHEHPVLAVPSRSIHDMLNDSLDTQDDGNTTTTSGSYTIDHEDFASDLPQTDVYV